MSPEEAAWQARVRTAANAMGEARRRLDRVEALPRRKRVRGELHAAKVLYSLAHERLLDAHLSGMEHPSYKPPPVDVVDTETR